MRLKAKRRIVKQSKKKNVIDKNMIVQIILGVIILLVSIVILMVAVSTETSSTYVVSFVIAIIGIYLIVTGHCQIPKAIDVYQGETTLQITYQDGIPVDSVVIFKKK